MVTGCIGHKIEHTTLVIVLKGQFTDEIRDRKWDTLPVFGDLKNLTKDEIGVKVDWCLQNGFVVRKYSEAGRVRAYFEPGPLFQDFAQQLWTDRLLEIRNPDIFTKSIQCIRPKLLEAFQDRVRTERDLEQFYESQVWKDAFRFIDKRVPKKESEVYNNNEEV
jgi:hypothetical protein